jgi:hypothetical protein
LVRLLEKKQGDLQKRKIAYRITGIASRRLGWIADPKGISIPSGARALSKSYLHLNPAMSAIGCAKPKPTC